MRRLRTSVNAITGDFKPYLGTVVAPVGASANAAAVAAAERMGNPISIPVTAGTEVVANVEMLSGSAASQSFMLNTSIRRP